MKYVYVSLVFYVSLVCKCLPITNISLYYVYVSLYAPLVRIYLSGILCPLYHIINFPIILPLQNHFSFCLSCHLLFTSSSQYIVYILCFIIMRYPARRLRWYCFSTNLPSLRLSISSVCVVSFIFQSKFH